MQAKMDIWNAALDRIGENLAIEDEQDERVAALVCKRHYDRCRKEVLTSGRWPFATGQKAISRLTGQSRVGWAYVYALPTDCLEPRVLLGDGVRWGLTTPESRIPFDVMSNDAGDGQVLCCDIGPGDFEALEYTRDIEAVPAFSAHFESALEWRLAAELALAIKKSRADYDRIMHPVAGDYVKALALASTSAFRGRQEDVEPETASIRARS